MSEATAAADDQHTPGRYEIRIGGHLDARWAARFDGLSLTHESDGTTVLSGPVVDQAALHGLLRNVRDLGLPLVSVTQVDLKQANGLDAVAVAANTQIKESTVKITASKFIRWAGVSAVVGGSLFVGIQAIHPPESLSSVTTDAWANVHYLGVAMCLLNLLGIAGIYARQVEEAGWLGLAGFLLFAPMWALTAAFQFAEAFILPLLATEAPTFVERFLGITSGSAGENLGALPAVWSLTGGLYLLGGVLFGIATLRAGILPRWAAGVLAFGTVAPLALSLLPHEFVPLAAVPVGVALASLGYALWSERREKAPAASGAGQSPQLLQTAAE